VKQNTATVAHLASRPIAYRVELAREIAVALERYAAQQDQKPETIIAEALRPYLGVDA